MDQASLPLQVSCNDKESTGSCRFERYTTAEAIRHGIKMFLLTLGAAIVSIVLPGVHFVSVPLGTLASPLIGAYCFFKRKGAAKSMSGNFVCPECQAHNAVSAPGTSPYYAGKCFQCQHDFRLVPLAHPNFERRK